MKINLKHSKTRWVDIDEESQFMIDYPTIEQQDEIDLILAEIMFMDESLMGIVDKEQMEEKLKSFSAKNKAQVTHLNKKLGRLAIKYQVKDWKGISNGRGKPVKCRLVSYGESGTQMEEKLFNSLIQELKWWELVHIYNCFTQETELTETDKKKL